MFQKYRFSFFAKSIVLSVLAGLSLGSCKTTSSQPQVNISSTVAKSFLTLYLDTRKPLAFAITSDGKNASYNYCSALRCRSEINAANKVVTRCEATYKKQCQLFAIRRAIVSVRENGTPYTMKDIQAFASGKLQAKARAQLGLSHDKGLKSNQDYEAVFKWYQKTAKRGDRGDIEAQFQLAEMYKNGLGTPQNYEKAIKWYEIVAKDPRPASISGYIWHWQIRARHQLGDMYYNGEGVAQDYEKAFVWYLGASKYRNREAEFIVAEMFRVGRGTQPDMNEAITFYIKSANKGHVEALAFLGELYQQGLHVPKDLKRAKRYYLQAAKKGHVNAQMSLGDMYQKGLGGSKNNDQARKWHRLAAEQGDAASLNKRDQLEHDNPIISK